MQMASFDKSLKPQSIFDIVRTLIDAANVG